MNLAGNALDLQYNTAAGNVYFQAAIDDLSQPYVKERLCETFEKIPRQTVRSMLMVASLYTISADVFIGPNGELKDKRAMCDAVVRYIQGQSHGWRYILQMVKIPLQIVEYVNRIVFSAVATANITGSFQEFMNYATDALQYISLNKFSSIASLTAYVQLGVMFLTGFLKLIQRGLDFYAVSAYHSIAQDVTMKEAQQLEMEIPRTSVQDVGDAFWHQLCLVAGNKDIVSFRRAVIQKEKRAFYGRSPLAIHFFTPAGAERLPLEVCQAFIKYPGPFYENVLGQ